MASPANTPLTEAALQQAFYDRLPAPLQRILRQLVANYPDPISRQALGEATGYEASGRTFAKYVSTLSSLGLVERPTMGQLRASPVLFLGAAA